MTDHADVRPTMGLRRGSIEPLSPQAWQRVETAVFARLEAAVVPWSLAPAPLHSYAAPRFERPLRLHWAASVGLALASAAAAASALHYLRPRPVLEAGPPAELGLPPTRPTMPPPDPAQPSELQPLDAAQPSAGVPLHAAQTPVAPATHTAPLPALPIVPLARTPRREPVERPAARSDRERLFERAASLESANAPLALALYLSLASGDDAWAANALFAAARLEIERGLSNEGGQHLDDYLARFPAGENSVDVSGLRRRAGMPSP